MFARCSHHEGRGANRSELNRTLALLEHDPLAFDPGVVPQQRTSVHRQPCHLLIRARPERPPFPILQRHVQIGDRFGVGIGLFRAPYSPSNTRIWLSEAIQLRIGECALLAVGKGGRGELLPRHPVVSVAFAIKQLGVSKPTVGRDVDVLEKAGVLVETTGKRRDRSWVYQRYLDRLGWAPSSKSRGDHERARNNA